MLSKNQMVKARKAVESLYTGVCTITERRPGTKPNGSTGFMEETVLVDQPCRLSYSGSNSASSEESASRAGQSIKVYLAPEIRVAPGSRLTITQNGVTEVYRNSGRSAVFQTHQEISLELFEEWT